MRVQGVKTPRSMARPPPLATARSYVGYGLALGFLLVLLTYLAVSTQYSAIIPNSFSAVATTVQLPDPRGGRAMGKPDDSADGHGGVRAQTGELDEEESPEETTDGQENEGLWRKQLEEEEDTQNEEQEVDQEDELQRKKDKQTERASREVDRREFEDAQDDPDTEEDSKNTEELDEEREEWKKQKNERTKQVRDVVNRREFDDGDNENVIEEDRKTTEGKEQEVEPADNEDDPKGTDPGLRMKMAEADPVVNVEEPRKKDQARRKAEAEEADPDETAKAEEHGIPQFAGGTEDFNLPPQPKPICDQSFAKYDTCDLDGDVRTIGGSSVVMLVSPRSAGGQHEWKIKPYSRKYLDGLKEVTVKTVVSGTPGSAPPCSVRLNVPAMVIELGGLTGNYWHDFTDVLIPLFIGARQFKGQVQFLVVNMLPFWVDKYKKIFAKLSAFEMIEFEHDYAVRCYPRAVVGYGSRKEFTIDPAETPNAYTMVDFTKFLRETYGLPRAAPVRARDGGGRPRMMIIDRSGSRKLLNMPEIIHAAEAVGFEVMVIGRTEVSYEDYAKIVNSFDVMVGVHGAGLTNCVYLPTGAVLIQVVPYGKLEHIAQTDFGDPAKDMGLKYIEYSVEAEESTLIDVFGKDHPMIADPLAIHRSGWQHVAEWYLGKQDLRISASRFTPTLRQAMEYLQ